MTISDFKNLPSDKVFDICIIGAGPAGLTLAADLIGRKVSVCLLESGGMELSREAQDLNSGEVKGLPYEPLNTCRLRGLGGSTQPMGWGALCKPLDEEDFRMRPWVSHSGWPFDREHLTPYYVRAQETLGTSDLNELQQRPRLPVGQSTHLRLDMASVCGNLRVGQHLRQPLDAAKNVFVILNCTVLQLRTDNENTRVCHAVVRQGPDQICVKARTFVLAAGGIENARLMLLSQGVGNQNGLVGRFFMDHPRFTVGTIVPRNREAMKALFQLDRVRIARRQKIKRALRPQGSVVVQGLTLSTEALTSGKLLNHRAWIEPCFLGQDADKLASLRSTFLASERERVGRGSTRAGSIGEQLKIPSPSSGLVWTWLMHMTRPAVLARSFRLHHILEPEPNPSSRVVLSEIKDRFGLPQAQLHWHLTEATLGSLRRTIDIIGQELCENGIGKLVVQPKEWEALQRPNWTWHHMGTTRMHNDPRQGVVDANCKVHGTSNLFVVGSSVFPTAGNDLPTLTVVALAHRLADRLKSFQPELSIAS
ncbi:GMC family oxidoreductase [Mesorhizobium sp.]|uniref:FAD-dependent oxidoreductase n=1 Tax=Mesorhizobium sp. TaxID=1871066 RepID=UPI001223A3DE|nr:GMC family oxidoreductase [Mesorhizobium sp.]TIS54210.1 MAG: GMC family oxidoreductase [Mesorhizobium sp.]TIS88590.1 MAG: GMC family oxidoreductase [Mesorhizobium sp.]